MSEGSTPEIATQPIKPKGPSQQLRQFSKENSQDERTQAAQAIKAKRGEYFDRKSNLNSRKDTIVQQTTELGVQAEAKIQELAQTEETLGELSSSWYSRALHLLEIQRLRGKTGKIQASQVQIDSDLVTLKREESGIVHRLGEKGADRELGRARELLEDFYKNETRKWQSAPLSKEDMKKYFSEEYLSSLSTDDYYELLNRYPGHMVAHVTRQGIRDHTGHMYHTAGKGEYHDGFIQILKDGKLRSPLGAYLKDGVKKEAIVQFLGLDSMGKERALAYLDLLSREKYADKTAVHFAIGLVADVAYGGESGNEIFFSFPSAFIAANFYFSGSASVEMGLDSDWNDQWVFPQSEDRGININAGLVNIPRSALVDPRTGSKYELDENNNPIKEGNSFKLAVNTISSKQYWEKYFLEHPDQTPKHVGWYEGDPTRYVNKRRHQENIYPQFNENSGNPPGLDENARRFYEIGREAIEEYYSEQPVTV